MTEPEKKRRIEELRRELKELEAVPRSDWHKAFEAFLNLRIAKYDGVRIDKELFTSLAFPPNSGMNVCGNSSQFTRLTGNKEEVRKEVMRIWLKIA